MTAFSFLFIQAAPIPLKFFFLVGAVVLLIIGIVIFAYRSYIKSDDPTEDDLSALHIGTHATIPPQPVSPSPATRKQAPVIQQSARLSTPAPVENKILPPPIVLTEPAPPPVARIEPPPPLPLPATPQPVQQTIPLPQRNVTSPLTEELPSNSPRTLASPRVFSPTTPRQDAPAQPVAPMTYDAAPVAQTPVQPQTYTEPHRVSEPEVFGSLTQVQKNQSRSNRFTLVILFVAVVGTSWVGFTYVPTIHDAVMGVYDKVTGHNPPPPPVAQTPKIEIEQKVTLAGPILYVDGKVRNISDGPLDNLYAEITVLYTNGKLSETRLTPILAGAAQSTTAAQTGKETSPPKEERSLPPSQNGRYKLEVPGATFHDAHLKRILREDGAEVMFQKK